MKEIEIHNVNIQKEKKPKGLLLNSCGRKR